MHDLIIKWQRYVALAFVGAIFFPVLPGLFYELQPLFHLGVWDALFLDPSISGALTTTVVSSLVGSLGALCIAVLIAIRLYPGEGWYRAQNRLPLFLAIPHVAFAVGLFFLFDPSGAISRLIALFLHWLAPPDWVTVKDAWGLSLAFGLAVKESWFLVWVIGTVITESDFRRQMNITRSLGYSSYQAWLHVLLPQVLPRLMWPITAVFAYSVSVVDMALVLGPSQPPTFAVLVWRWLNDIDPMLQHKGQAGSVVLMIVVLVLVTMTWLAGKGLSVVLRSASGKRTESKHERNSVSYLDTLLGSIGGSVVIILVIWSLAQGWFFPEIFPSSITLRHWLTINYSSLWTTVWLALIVASASVMISLLWLEWGPKRYNNWIYLPLVIPSLPLVVAQYMALIRLQLDGTALAVIWSHMLWAFPYSVLVLVGPYRSLDRRYGLIGQVLGMSSLIVSLRIKWPILLRPICAAFAVAFSVSVVQYLPTVFSGSGKWSTVTTEAVNLSAGGSRQKLAVYALLQGFLPWVVFWLARVIPSRVWSARKGVR